MRGNDTKPAAMFSYVSAEERVPQDHPLRAVRAFVDEILRDMTREFDALYASHGRPSIPPERLLRAQLLQLFYSIRSERLLMEQLDYNILFRWFVGLEMDEPIWVPTVFSKNRDRLLQHAVAHSFFQRVVARAADLMSDEHFTVDGTLIEAWCSMKSFRPKEEADADGPPPDEPGGRNAEVDFRGEKRSNETHASTTDPEKKFEAPMKFATNSVAGRSKTRAASPACSTRPRCITAIRSLIVSASSWSCVTNTKVMPRER